MTVYHEVLADTNGSAASTHREEGRTLLAFTAWLHSAVDNFASFRRTLRDVQRHGFFVGRVRKLKEIHKI